MNQNAVTFRTPFELAAITLLILVAVPVSNAATIEKTFSPPEGYTRIHSNPGGFTHYLRQLNILPESEPVRRYDGSPVHGWPGTVRIIDLPFLFETDLEQCADVGYRLYSDFALDSKADSLLTFRLQNGQTISWSRWKIGKRLRYSSEMGVHVEADYPPDSSETAYRSFLHYLFQWTGSAAMKDYLYAATEEQLMPGDLIVQNTTGGIGHVSILLDKCVNNAGDALYLIANGWTPAQTPFVWKPGSREGIGYWFTIEGYRHHMAPLDFGPFLFRTFRM